MSASRPWWASDGPVEGGVDPAQDPLLAHRNARRGPLDPDDDASDPDADGPAPGPTHGPAPGPTDGPAPGPTHGPAPGPTTHRGSEICGVCPICIAARVIGETRPELLTHLTEAGRHLSAALRSLLETPTERDAPAHGDGPDDRGVRRIDLD